MRTGIMTITIDMTVITAEDGGLGWVIFLTNKPAPEDHPDLKRPCDGAAAGNGEYFGEFAGQQPPPRS